MPGTGESQGFLCRLHPSRTEALLDLGRPRRYPVRSTIFFEGDEAHEVLVVRNGRIKVTASSADGREVLLDVLGRDEILGELSAVDGGRRSASATALTRVDVIAIPVTPFRTYLRENPDVTLELLQSVVARLRGASRRQVEFGTLDALGRVCRRLVEMQDRFGAADRHAGELTAPLTQQDLAAWAGVSREAVVKALRALRALGWISVAGRRISVLDADAVRARARQSE